MRTTALHPTAPLPWPAREAWVPALLAVVAWEWGRFAAGEFAHALGARAHVPLLAAVAAFVLVRVASFAIEAGVYVLVWRALGCRVPAVRLACWIAAFSLADLVALSLGRSAALHPHAAPAFALALGPRVVWHATGPLAHAFGGLGALAALRIGLTAWAQARALGVRLRVPLIVTVVLWAIGRLLVGFGYALLRGPVGVT
jgi:hypothetical protein